MASIKEEKHLIKVLQEEKDLNPVDYSNWGIFQEKVQHTHC